MAEKEVAYFHNIKGLLIPKSAGYRTFHENINRYIDAAQGLADSLTKCYANRRFEYFIKNMETAVYLLSMVRARWLETEGMVILKNIKSNRIDEVKKRISPFISGLLALSIEMQKAQNQAGETKEKQLEEQNLLEEHEDMAQNLTAVETLISDGDYGMAQNILAEMDEQNPREMLVNLFKMVVTKQYDKAEKLANVLKEKHIEAIREFGGEGKEMKVILAVDDMPEMLASVKYALSDKYQVSGVTSGAAALKFLQNKKPDLFILDIDMPIMDGCQLADEIRKIKDHAETPIIFLTGNSSREDVLRAMRAGGNDFIVKPANPNTLLAKVGKFIA
ncbi:MAG: response regulator [Lachnospiraceae bacterium]|nr:response regulator [Lachnospiraceae bacterium]